MSTYAYLGPVGTFTEAALRKVTYESDTLVPYANVTAARRGPGGRAGDPARVGERCERGVHVRVV